MSIDIEWAKQEMERTGKKNCNKDFVYYSYNNTQGVSYADCSSLVKSSNGVKVLWESSLGKSITIYSNGVEIKKEIKNYKKEKGGILVLEDCEIKISTLRQGCFRTIPGVPRIDQKDYNFEYDINQMVKGVKIIDKHHKLGRKGYTIINDFSQKHEVTEHYLKNRSLEKISKKTKVLGDYDFIRPFINTKDYNITSGSHEHVSCTCNVCLTNIQQQAYNLVKYGFKCTECNDRVMSIGEKVMYHTLKIKSKEFLHDKKIPNSNLNRRFDFILRKDNTCIETHGIQHYKEGNHFGKVDSYKNTKLSDEEKRRYCMEKNITLIEIDTSSSDVNTIIDNINSSDLSFKIEDHEKRTIVNKVYSRILDTDSIVKDYLDLMTYTELEIKYNIGKSKLIDILQCYNVIGKRKQRHTGKNRRVKVKCINTGDVFASVGDANLWCGLKKDSGLIGMVCKGKRNTTGKHPTTGEKLYWEYVD